LLEEVLEKTIEKAKQSIKSRKTKGNPEKVGVAAIKYAILRNEPIKDVQFSWKEALNFEGETGPYLQYSYARASSILRKSKKKPKLAMPIKLEDKEILLIKKIQDFPKEVKRAARDFNPSIIANYAYKLAQIFNEFYHDTKVIGTKEEEFRLKLIEAFRITIKNALYLLGINVMEEM
jgi:arginyl-tRNA synthetase